MITFAWVLWWILIILLGVLAAFTLLQLIAAIYAIFKYKTYRYLEKWGYILLTTLTSGSLDIAFFIFLCSYLFTNH